MLCKPNIKALLRLIFVGMNGLWYGKPVNSIQVVQILCHALMMP